MSDGYVCPECHLDYDALAPGDIPGRVRQVPAPVRERLTGVADELLRVRPDASTWSAIEYAAHLSDAYDAFTDMVPGMRAGKSMKDFFWDPDERAIEQHYAEQPVDEVLDHLDTNATRLADALDTLSGQDWALTAEFAWGERDLLTMARNAVHEGVHHTQDIDRVLSRVRDAG